MENINSFRCSSLFFVHLLEQKAMSGVSNQISQISTQISFVLTAANKRKFEFDSHSCRNTKRHTLARPNNMGTQIVTLDVHEVFRQLRFARYGEGSFQKFRDWNDTNLWKDLVRVLIEQRHIHINLDALFSVVSGYAKSYAEKPDMTWLTDESLKRDVVAVFKPEPLADQKGCLSIEQVEAVMQNMRNIGLMGCDEQVGESSNPGRKSGGRNPVKRFRARSSSTDERNLKCSEDFEDTVRELDVEEQKIICKKLTAHFNNDKLSAREVNDTIEKFFSTTAQMKVRARIWAKMSDAKQIAFVKDFSSST